MAISSFSGDVNVIAALHDNPVMDDNLTAQQFKEKFDYASGLIKAYINGTLVSAINKNIGDIAANTTAIAGKQNTLTFDNAPVSGSNNPVKSGGIYTALAGKQDVITTASQTVETSGWSNNTATVSVPGLQSTDNIIVAPAPASFYKWRDCGIYCSSQTNGGITLTCEDVPDTAITVQILIVR